jgi:hypothetical protein
VASVRTADRVSEPPTRGGSEPLDLEGDQMSYEQPLGSPERPDIQPPGGPAGQPSGRHSQGPKPFARFRNAAIAVVLLILVGTSVYSIVKVSSVQASLSHAQQQISAESPSCPPSSNK